MIKIAFSSLLINVCPSIRPEGTLLPNVRKDEKIYLGSYRLCRRRCEDSWVRLVYHLDVHGAYSKRLFDVRPPVGAWDDNRAVQSRMAHATSRDASWHISVTRDSLRIRTDGTVSATSMQHRSLSLCKRSTWLKPRLFTKIALRQWIKVQHPSGLSA